MIAMYLTALPVPPLPVWVKMTSTADDGGGETKEGLTSSHDLLAALLVAAMDRDRADLNKTRMEQQQALVEEFMKEMAEMTDVAAYFEACVRFTGGFVHAFCDPQQTTPQVRFGDLDQVEKGDKLHTACSHWMAAQDIVHETDVTKRRTSAHYATQTYSELLTARMARRAPMI
jgi:hypothetical protein